MHALGSRVRLIAIVLLIGAIGCVAWGAAPTDATPDKPAKVLIGTFDGGSSFNRYWRVVEYNKQLERTKIEYKRLIDNGEEARAKEVKAKLDGYRKAVYANFDKDLAAALEGVAQSQGLSAIVRGEVTFKAENVEVMDVTPLVMALISQAPESATTQPATQPAE